MNPLFYLDSCNENKEMYYTQSRHKTHVVWNRSIKFNKPGNKGFEGILFVYRYYLDKDIFYLKFFISYKNW